MDTENLIKNIKDFFLAQYNKSLQNSKTFIAFEPLGHMVSPDDYKAFGQYDAQTGNLQLSRLCDIIPKIGELIDSEGFESFSDKYIDLKDSLTYTSKNVIGDDKPYAEKFLKLKAKTEELLQGQPTPFISATETDPNAKVYLAKGIPNGWYDPNSNIWAHNTVKQSDPTAHTPPPPPGRPTNIHLVWKLNPIMDKVVTNRNFKTAFSNKSFLTKMNLADFHQPSTSVSGSQKVVAKTTVEKSIGIAHATASTTLASTNILATNTALVKSNNIPVINRQFYSAMQTTMPFSQLVKVNRVIGNVNNAETKQVQSSDFVIDFSYAVVNIERPWLNAALFEEGNAKLWYALGQKAGSYSTGDNDPSNKGMLRAVPKAMIVVKDLSITAKWTEEDKKIQATSFGLFSFNTSNSHFNNNSLIIPGIQILGWVCEVLPKIPLNDDVNIR